MGQMILKYRLLPESAEVDVEKLKEEIKQVALKYKSNEDIRIEIQEIAFGLKSFELMFVVDEKIESTDVIEQDLSKIEKINSVELLDMRRVFG
jgi:translation elongation factor aEF-1 beta